MKSLNYGVACVLVVGLTTAAGAVQALSPEEELGKSIFFDRQLSLKKNQSCADCHAEKVGFTGPKPGINRKGTVYNGSVRKLTGNRRPPSAAYATQSPVLHYIERGGRIMFEGGNFYDGRATGEKLGNPAADQAQGPFLNPVEQALPDAACVVYRVCNPASPAKYPVTLEDVWGVGACAVNWPGNVDRACRSGRQVDLDMADRARVDAAYDQIALSIAAYEASAEVNPYSSKFDASLVGGAELNAQEQLGLEIFNGKARCSLCHRTEPQVDGNPPLFTDYGYANLGVPRNVDNPIYAEDPDFVDQGLGGFLAGRPEYAVFAADNVGKHKAPSLRNVDRRPGKGKGFAKAYMHNGYFKTLEGVVNFYNTRDVKPACADPLTREADALDQGCWPAPEVAANMLRGLMGDLGLTAEEEAALVAFMKTLSDGYVGSPARGLGSEGGRQGSRP